MAQLHDNSEEKVNVVADGWPRQFVQSLVEMKPRVIDKHVN